MNENLWTGQADLSYKIDGERPITLSTGYFYQGTDRYSSRIQFNYQTSDGRAPRRASRTISIARTIC